MRIAGITLPENKRMDIALTAIFGVGRSRALEILEIAKVKPELRPKDVSPKDENEIRRLIESKPIEGELRRKVAGNIKRLKDIKAYRGIRHMRGLHTRGQRTKTNSRTRRGNIRKTMGTGRRAVEKK